MCGLILSYLTVCRQPYSAIWRYRHHLCYKIIPCRKKDIGYTISYLTQPPPPLLTHTDWAPSSNNIGASLSSSTSGPVISTDLKEPPLIVYPRGCNLRDILVHAYTISVGESTQTLLKPPNGCSKCRVCAQCNNTIKGNYFTHPDNGKEYFIKDVTTWSV